MTHLDESKPKAPDAEYAAEIATRVIGCAPTSVRRFTGMVHYVFGVAFADRPSIVVRIGDASARTRLAGALRLSAFLRPRGVPLPAILADDIQAELPWMAMERLPGTDLGAVITALSKPQLDQIAAEVARAQAITARTGSARLYGYASRSERAPHAAWSHVLEDSLSRSRARIASAELFDVGLVEIVRAEFAALRSQIDEVAPTPFLHDTTTKNVLVAPDGRFSGIVDVDDLCFGDARYPAALTLAVLEAYHDGPVEYVSAWLRAAGQKNDRVFQLYVAVFLLDLMGEHGHAFNGNERPSEPAERAALLRAFRRRAYTKL
ncbi:MAG: aminoglycoside phosphotransferase family protein [Roseiarcus sp.]